MNFVLTQSFFAYKYLVDCRPMLINTAFWPGSGGRIKTDPDPKH